MDGLMDGWMQVGWVGRFLVCKVAHCYILVHSYLVDCVPQVCEYGLGVCAGVPVADRGGLLGVWVQCKQLLQQPIPGKTFGVEEKVGIVLQVISAITSVCQNLASFPGSRGNEATQHLYFH